MDNQLYKCIIEDENAEEAKKLMLHVDPSIGNNRLIQFAIFYDKFDMVKLLLRDKRVNPTIYTDLSYQSYPVYDMKILKLLLHDKRVNPTNNNWYYMDLLEAEGNPTLYKSIINLVMRQDCAILNL